VALNGTQQLAATVANTTNQGLTWSVQEGAAGGSVTTDGLYTAPQNVSGTFHVEVISNANTKQGDIATLTVHLRIARYREPHGFSVSDLYCTYRRIE